MVVMPEISAFEIALHIIMFAFATATVFGMFYISTQFSSGELRRIIQYYSIAFFFAALRWVGGSMARMDLPITSTISFNIAWTLAGVLSAGFGLYASKLLFDFSKSIGFVQKRK